MHDIVLVLYIKSRVCFYNVYLVYIFVLRSIYALCYVCFIFSVELLMEPIFSFLEINNIHAQCP